MDIARPENIAHCIRCGTCCLKGGPVLHHEDKEILLSGHAGHQHLVTLRKDELALDPLRNMLKPVRKELIKVKGKGDGWSCLFYNEEGASCRMYENRFLECRLLQCWDTSRIESVIGKKTIVRSDIINPGDPILKVIGEHEKECPLLKVNILISSLYSGKEKSDILSQLAGYVRRDLAIRSYAFSELGLNEEFELFIFGRPLHKSLHDRGLSVRTVEDNILIDFKTP
jgi:Fe-S-cluster containining protein